MHPSRCGLDLSFTERTVLKDDIVADTEGALAFACKTLVVLFFHCRYSFMDLYWDGCLGPDAAGQVLDLVNCLNFVYKFPRDVLHE